MGLSTEVRRTSIVRNDARRAIEAKHRGGEVIGRFARRAVTILIHLLAAASAGDGGRDKHADPARAREPLRTNQHIEYGYGVGHGTHGFDGHQQSRRPRHAEVFRSSVFGSGATLNVRRKRGNAAPGLRGRYARDLNRIWWRRFDDVAREGIRTGLS